MVAKIILIKAAVLDESEPTQDELNNMSVLTDTSVDWWDAHLAHMKALRSDPAHIAAMDAWRKEHPTPEPEQADYPSFDQTEYNDYNVWQNAANQYGASRH